MRRWYATLGLVTAAVVVVAGLLTPTWAWARYRATGAETNTFATHVLLAPVSLSCSGLGVLSVTLTWGAASDAAYVTGYDVGESSSSGGPYLYTSTGAGTSTSMTMGISSGAHYYVIAAVNHLWMGSPSPQQRVTGILFLAATCP